MLVWSHFVAVVVIVVVAIVVVVDVVVAVSRTCFISNGASGIGRGIRSYSMNNVRGPICRGEAKNNSS